MVKTKRPLKRSILVGSVLFMVLLCFVMSRLEYNSSKTELYSQCEANMGKILNYVASEIDADDLANCISTGIESEKYGELQKLLDKVKERFELHFIYIIVPLSAEPVDNVKNVIAGATQYEYEFEADELVRLNTLTGDSYSPETAQKYLDAYQSGKLSFFEETSEWGNDYTGLLPIFDSAGEKVAALCVDVDAASIHATLRSNTVEVILLIVMLSGIFIGIFYYWMNRYVTEPMGQLVTSVVEFASKCRNQKDPEALKIDVSEIQTHNEVKTLASAVAEMGDAIREYVNNLIHTENELARIIAQANKDSLTEVRNKKAYDEYTAGLQAKMGTDESLAFALLAADLNDLKKVNDACGKEKGDLYIKKCCRVICEVFSHSPVFRVGPDKFAVILTGHDFTERDSLVKWIQSVFQEMCQDETIPLWERCSVHFGMADYHPGVDHTYNEIRDRAVEQLRLEKERD